MTATTEHCPSCNLGWRPPRAAPKPRTYSERYCPKCRALYLVGAEGAWDAGDEDLARAEAPEEETYRNLVHRAQRRIPKP